MLKCFAVLLAPQHIWARVPQIISWLLQSRLASAVFNLLHGNGPWDAGHAKLHLETPFGEVFTVMGEGHVPALIYRIDRPAILPFPEYYLISIN